MSDTLLMLKMLGTVFNCAFKYLIMRFKNKVTVLLLTGSDALLFR